MLRFQGTVSRAQYWAAGLAVATLFFGSWGFVRMVGSATDSTWVALAIAVPILLALIYAVTALTVARLRHLGASLWWMVAWPVTDADIEHARTNPSYMKCDVPRLEEFDFTLSSNRRFYNVSADPVKGCVSDITITEYHWQPSQRVWFSPNPSVDFDPESFTIPAANTKIRITLKPANQKYGGERYLQYRGVPE